jgi:type I restriction enzyme S subunit
VRSEFVLRDLIDSSLDGEWGKGEPTLDHVPMLCIRGTDFAAARVGSVDGVPVRYVQSKKAERKALRPFDIVIEVAGGTKNEITGRTLLLRPQLFERAEHPLTCASFSRFIRVQREQCDPEYMFWYLQHLYASGAMHAYHTQHTGVARFQWTTFAAREPILLPRREEQRRIAGILSAYDELIENCERRIRVLDEMARSLYREWFVDFRFPGHEKATPLDSPIGRIPREWDVVRLGDVMELNYGKALKASDRRGGPVPVFASSGCVGWHDDLLCRGPGIVLGRKGNVGSVFWSDSDFFVIDTAYYVTSSLPLRFVFFDLQTKNFINNDSAVPGLSRHQAYALEMVVPPPALLTRFEAFAAGTMGLAGLLRRRVENLRTTRDLLLPRLLSGQLTVDDAA